MPYSLESTTWLEYVEATAHPIRDQRKTYMTLMIPAHLQINQNITQDERKAIQEKEAQKLSAIQVGSVTVCAYG